MPALNNCRTISNESIVSCAVCVGKPYIKYACTIMPASVKCLFTLATWATVIPLSINCSKRSDATSSPPDTAIQPEAFNNRHRSIVKFFSKRTLVHQLTTSFLFIISNASARIKAGGAASSTK